MAFLLDTNVLSELRKGKRCDPHVAQWQQQWSDEDCFISVLSLAEILRGILKIQRTDPGFSQVLQSWYETRLKPGFSGRILSIDFEIAEISASILSGRTRELADGLIAATALVHQLTLVTRNTADFEDTGVALLNPWSSPG